MKAFINRPLFFVLTIAIFLSVSLPVCAQGPQLQIVATGTKTSLRGLCVVNDNVIWVSGSHGIVGKSLNSGKNWNWMTVKGFEDKEFRDIEAFDANTAVIIAVGEPAYILKTTDGGETWKVVYENKTKGMFLDAMDFSDFSNGIVVGDPINNNIFLATTSDNGSTWREVSARASRPKTDSGEAFFAASGTNIRLFRDSTWFLVSGGTKARLITNTDTMKLEIIQGKESTGCNSIDIYDNGNARRPGKRMIIIGGDFNAPASTVKNCLYTTNGGKSWKAPKVPPHGYRSCVEFLSMKDILSCGINGIDYSNDGGKTWKWISKEGFNVCRIARNGSAIYLAGNNGKIARFLIE